MELQNEEKVNMFIETVVNEFSPKEQLEFCLRVVDRITDHHARIDQEQRHIISTAENKIEILENLKFEFSDNLKKMMSTPSPYAQNVVAKPSHDVDVERLMAKDISYAGNSVSYD